MDLLKKRLNLILIPFLVVLIFFSIGYIIQRSDYFKIKKIYVNNQMISERTMKAILRENVNESLVLIDTEKLQKRFQEFYSTHQVQVIKHYPDILNVNIIFNEIICYLYINDQNQRIFWALNKNAQIVKAVNKVNKGIPIITAPLNSFSNLRWDQLRINLVLNYPVVKDITKSLTIIKQIENRFFSNIDTLFLFKNSKDNYFKLSNLNSKFIFGPSMNTAQLIKVYSLEKDLISRINFKTVDLKYDDIIGRN